MQEYPAEGETPVGQRTRGAGGQGMAVFAFFRGGHVLFHGNAFHMAVMPHPQKHGVILERRHHGFHVTQGGTNLPEVRQGIELVDFFPEARSIKIVAQTNKLGKGHFFASGQGNGGFRARTVQHEAAPHAVATRYDCFAGRLGRAFFPWSTALLLRPEYGAGGEGGRYV